MAKRGHPPKTERNEELVKMRDQMDLSFERLGEIYGISKQAAHKIYHTHHWTHQNQNLGVLKSKAILTSDKTQKSITEGG